MQAVILAAGRGVRMKPLTDTTAKPLLKVAGQPLLYHTFRALPDAVNEVIVVIGYLGEQIKAYLGSTFRGRKIRYVVQQTLQGTAKALWEVRTLLRGTFLVLMADDMYRKEDILKCLEHERALVAIKSERNGPGGKVVLDARGVLRDVVEGKNHPAGTLVSVGAFLLTPEIFSYEPVKLTDREGEWGLPQTIVRMAKDLPVSIVYATRWIKVTSPEDFVRAEKLLEAP